MSVKSVDTRYGHISYVKCDSCEETLCGRTNVREALGDAVLCDWKTIHNPDEIFTHTCPECLRKKNRMTTQQLCEQLMEIDGSGQREVVVRVLSYNIPIEKVWINVDQAVLIPQDEDREKLATQILGRLA